MKIFESPRTQSSGKSENESATDRSERRWGFAADRSRGDGLENARVGRALLALGFSVLHIRMARGLIV